MKAKTEKCWMAWHPNHGFYLCGVGADAVSARRNFSEAYYRQMSDEKLIEVRIVPVKVRKRK